MMLLFPNYKNGNKGIVICKEIIEISHDRKRDDYIGKYFRSFTI